MPKFPTVPLNIGRWAVAEYVTDCHVSGVLSKVLILPLWVLLAMVCTFVHAIFFLTLCYRLFIENYIATKHKGEKL